MDLSANLSERFFAEREERYKFSLSCTHGALLIYRAFSSLSAILFSYLKFHPCCPYSQVWCILKYSYVLFAIQNLGVVSQQLSPSFSYIFGGTTSSDKYQSELMSWL